MDRAKRVVLSGVTTVTVTSPSEAVRVMARASSQRTIADNNVNARSSRSHAITIVKVSSHQVDTPDVQPTYVVLVMSAE